MKGLNLIFIPFWCGFFGAVGAFSGIAVLKTASTFVPLLKAVI